jgi:hypothetical protein
MEKALTHFDNDNETWQTLTAATARLLERIEHKRSDDGGNHTESDEKQRESTHARDVAHELNEGMLSHFSQRETATAVQAGRDRPRAMKRLIRR